MATFENALALVFKDEGGFANDPDDTPTNYGITQGVYSAFLGRAASVSDVRAMPIDAAVKIYRVQYWNAIRGDDIVDQDLANAFLNMAVLRGVTAASKTMQAVLNIAQDGKVGPMTVKAINQAYPLMDFVDACVLAFARICVANPVKLKFLVNWVSRAQRLNS